MKAAAKLKLPTNQPPIPQRVQLLRDSPQYGPIPQGQGRRDFGSKTRVRKIRLGRSRRNSNGYRTMQEFICSCQGNCKNLDVSSLRTGCKGKIKDDIGKTLRVLEDMKRADPVSRSHATRSQ
ncbi:hypothetical protein BS78_08G033600 [Paspalum vaginatum]|nr:hypothetical protein BS78_08G033600 [Paspalum vaginatum]